MRIRSLRAIRSPVSAAGAWGEAEQRCIQLFGGVDLSLAAVRGEVSSVLSLRNAPAGTLAYSTASSKVIDG